MPPERTRRCTSLQPRPSVEADNHSSSKAGGTVCRPHHLLHLCSVSLPPGHGLSFIKPGFIHGQLQHSRVEGAVADWWVETMCWL